ncbi:hypothetical protein [Streptomyces sp. NEAU-YJ-81]|uniref:hypothetical protein n=1 Tax=Streptomyces sp. NEAU-YJ-81 TaxID=2820288 RepID=UPI001FB8A634|nr:hypothetical protein [Streptomyces sp. NEAU-YJ-81]
MSRQIIVIRRFPHQSGGVRLAPRQRSERHLTCGEREEIARGIAVGESARQRQAAGQIGVDRLL